MVRCVFILLLATVIATVAAADGAYRLFPGDLVRIEVFGHADLQIEARIPNGGDINFPLIGILAQVAGKSPETLAAEITARLADGYIRNPSVTVQVREYGPRHAWVVGAVKGAGQIKLDPLRTTTAQQAIGAAGGIDEDADRAGTMVMRDDPAKPGTKLAIPVETPEAAKADVLLEHGDVIVVPRADRVYVLGQVQYPRAVPLPSNDVLTVSKAISIAGGFGRFAKDNKVQLVRRGSQPQTIDVRAVLAGEKDAVDPLLKAGDTLFVPESRF